MRVLVVGSGGREHALAWRLSQSPQLSGLWVAGGNAGTGQIANNIPADPDDLDAVVSVARDHRIELVVVGPEAPLANGLVDQLQEEGIPAFGPTRAAAQIEASKGFARQLMRDAGVPGPEYRVFRDEPAALDFVRSNDRPLVVKADGLAAGKGVVICEGAAEAAMAVKSCMSDRAFGLAGETVLIEEMLAGPEISVFAFCDGENVSALVAACDYKQAGDGDQGPNTGGMGSFAPPDLWSESLAKDLLDSVMRPTVEALAQLGTPYQGILYAGMMLTSQGPKVLEFNCRLGDPEAQVVLPLLDSDPIEVMLACAEGRLSQAPVRWRCQPHVGVVLASGGYPGSYETGFEIHGLENDEPGTQVFHAGTRQETGNGASKVLTNGGRVLTVVGRGDSLKEARDKAYQRVESIKFEGVHFRRDIGTPRGSGREELWSSDPATRTS